MTSRPSTDTWNPTQYEKFRTEREQPFTDLVGLLDPRPSMQIVDLGCGTGGLTRRLHASLPGADTLGLDRSENMIAAATRDAPPPALRFELGDIETFEAPGSYDLIFSNAAFQWVDGHASLVGRLFDSLKPGGQLAFQVPAMNDEPTHATAGAIAELEPFRTALGGWRRAEPVLGPNEYARLLFRTGFEDQRVQLIVYPHLLEGPEAVVEWVRGTWLTPYQARLGAEAYAAFLAAYRERLLAMLPPDRPFFFPFKRILCWARRAA